jgi:hypothetical protein
MVPVAHKAGWLTAISAPPSALQRSESNIMTRAAGIAGGFVVALALAPIGADAQQISACVNNNSGEVKIVAPGASCRNGEHPLTWNAVGPQGPAGQALAGADFRCVAGTILGRNDLGPTPLTFKPSDGGVVFGSSISTAGTPPFTGLMLQPGIYQIHLSSGPGHVPFIPPVGASPGFTFFFKRASEVRAWEDWFGRWWRRLPLVLISFPGTGSFRLANSSFQFNTAMGQNGVISGDCELVITRLQ